MNVGGRSNICDDSDIRSEEKWIIINKVYNT
jgi:hypothetical protein